MNYRGVKIEEVSSGSIGDKFGIGPGDAILRINGRAIRDIIDYHFYVHENNLTVTLKKNNGERLEIDIEKHEEEGLGLGLSPFSIKRCNNRCVFCFVGQLPGGLRKSLYIKDEDYRLSFLYGNYITLTNLTKEDKERIYEQRLSPLYVSVHTTNNKLRRKMLGNDNVPDILREIKGLVSHKIKIHAQIVLCHGINDGANLLGTVEDLGKFYPYVSSVAVVPAGLTKYQKSSELVPLTQNDAINLIKALEPVRKRFRKKYGDNFVYPSDELYIKAGLDFPPLKEYGDLPQIENGVGMMQFFLSGIEKRVSGLKEKRIKDKTFVTFTGVSFAPFLKKAVDRLKRITGAKIEVAVIENKFFGDTVTVAGLLTGRDIIDGIKGKAKGDILLIPSVTLREGDDAFLDDITPGDVEHAVGIKTEVIDATAEGLIGALIQ